MREFGSVGDGDWSHVGIDTGTRGVLVEKLNERLKSVHDTGGGDGGEFCDAVEAHGEGVGFVNLSCQGLERAGVVGTSLGGMSVLPHFIVSRSDGAIWTVIRNRTNFKI